MTPDRAAVTLAAEATGLVARVASLGARLAVDRRRIAWVWTAERVGLFLDMWAAGHTHAEIAEAMGIDENSAKVRLHLIRRDHPALAEVADAARAACQSLRRAVGETRVCLACERPFGSEGTHNRVCDPCKRHLEGLQ